MGLPAPSPCGGWDLELAAPLRGLRVARLELSLPAGEGRRESAPAHLDLTHITFNQLISYMGLDIPNLYVGLKFPLNPADQNANAPAWYICFKLTLLPALWILLCHLSP